MAHYKCACCGSSQDDSQKYLREDHDAPFGTRMIVAFKCGSCGNEIRVHDSAVNEDMGLPVVDPPVAG